MRHRRQDPKSGEYLYKRALFKVFVGGKVFKIPFVAKPNQALNAAKIEELEESVINHIENSFSRLEFRRVVIGPNMINYIACGTKTAPGAANEQVSGDSGTPKVGEDDILQHPPETTGIRDSES